MGQIAGDRTSSQPPHSSMRIGNPLNWNTSDRVLLVACVVTPLTIWYLVVFHYLMAHHDVATYINRDVLAITIRFQTALVMAWLCLVLSLVLLRKTTPNGRWAVHALVALYVWTVAYFTFLIGPFTSMFMPVGILAGIAVGLILFDKRIVVPWVISALGFIAGMILIEQQGWIPYAPLLLRAPFENGHLHGSWILTVEGVGLSLLPIVAGLFYFLITNWHERESQLARAKEHLSKANDIIRRYVPSQVAEGVMTNIMGAVGKPERRKVTVFFSDVKGFSDMADLLDPEDLARILNEYLSEMSDIADRYGGTLDQFFGDGILIFFGAPIATTDQDHALRAVRMGLDMLKRVDELSVKWQNEVLESSFSIRIGINTGYASVGDFGSEGRISYMAVGRTTNLAARLQTNCTPGTILVSHSTWLLVRDSFECVPKGEITVKGSHVPVKVYEIEAHQSTG